MMHPRRTLTTTLLAALASCAPPPDVDTDDPAYSIAAAYCDAFTACDCAGFPEAKTSRSACEQRLIDSVGNPNLAFLRAEYPGVQFSIDPTCLESSEAWAEGLQCDGNSTRPLDCAALHCVGNLFSGPLATGDPCELSAQCQSGLYCDGLPRVCTDLCAYTYNPVGGPCGSQDQRCQDDLVCLADTCAQPGAAGDPCEDKTCGAGLFCADADGCQPRQDAGAPCTLYSSCKSFHCADGTCALELQLGDPCDVSSPQCSEGLTCFEGACREVPVLCTR